MRQISSLIYYLVYFRGNIFKTGLTEFYIFVTLYDFLGKSICNLYYISLLLSELLFHIICLYIEACSGLKNRALR